MCDVCGGKHPTPMGSARKLVEAIFEALGVPNGDRVQFSRENVVVMFRGIAKSVEEQAVHAEEANKSGLADIDFYFNTVQALSQLSDGIQYNSEVITGKLRELLEAKNKEESTEEKAADSPAEDKPVSEEK